MAFVPLATKLHPPPPCQTLVPRPRLNAVLSDALTHPLTLVSAPPGYGKTTLVASWLRTIDAPWAWLSLEEADDDPARFLQYLLASLRGVARGIDIDLLGNVPGSGPHPERSSIDLLIRALAAAEAPFVLVLDDFHTLHDASILEMLGHLLDHQPAAMHLAILTRADPPLPLPRLRSRGQLLEIRADRLRFTTTEIAAFLNRMMGADLPHADVEAMEERTEGWIAGLQLAALSMRSSPDVRETVRSLAGTHHYIMDYLVDEVLSLQAEDTRSFLLQTSILGRLCGELCSQVAWGEPARAVDGQQMLETLDRENLFVVPLDDDRRWYRYHHLFSDVLNRSLERSSPDRPPELHRRASDWFERNGHVQEAVHHALLAGDQERAVRLIEGNGCGYLMRGEGVTLLKWIEAVEPFTRTHAWLGVLKAWALTLTRRLDRAEQALRTAESLLSLPETTPEGRTVWGSICAARASRANIQGDTRLAAEFARQALDALPDANLFSCSMRGVATTVLGDASLQTGDLEGAGRAYSEAARIGHMADNLPMAILANTNWADILVEQGRLREAELAYRESLAMATRPDGQKWPLAERDHAGLAVISYERNELEGAEQHAEECLELCRKWGESEAQAVALALLAHVHRARGKPKGAQEAARSAEGLLSDRLASDSLAMANSSLARFWIAEGKKEKAAAFLQGCGAAADSVIPPLRLPEHIAQARLLAARGDLDGALALSARLLAAAESAGRMGRVIEILVVQAVARWSLSQSDAALAAVVRAISLARDEGYVRVFVDEGPTMARLLRLAAARGAELEYASELLSAMRKISAAAEPLAQPLIEPLTGRELEVLGLIEAGCSNQEIASRLVISVATLKRHITNLYAKLGVSSRTQALSAARELKLID